MRVKEAEWTERVREKERDREGEREILHAHILIEVINADSSDVAINFPGQ